MFDYEWLRSGVNYTSERFRFCELMMAASMLPVSATVVGSDVVQRSLPSVDLVLIKYNSMHRSLPPAPCVLGAAVDHVDPGWTALVFRETSTGLQGKVMYVVCCRAHSGYHGMEPCV